MFVLLSLMSGKRCMYALKTSREPLHFCTTYDTSIAAVAARHTADADNIIIAKAGNGTAMKTIMQQDNGGRQRYYSIDDI